jgi:anti-sigma-K factor RskA
MSSSEYIQSGIVEAYVLGLCTEQERAEIDTLRVNDTQLNEAITTFEIALEQKFMQEAVLPNAATDKKVLSIFAQSKSAPVVALHKKPRSKSNLWKYIATAACGLLLVSLYFNYSLYNKKDNSTLASTPKNTTNKTLSANDYAVLTNSAITPVAMYGVGTHGICRCTMFWDKSSKKAYFMMHHLPAPPNGKVYQIWAIVNGKPNSVGLIKNVVHDRFIEVPNVPDNAVKFSITLENNEKGNSTPTVEQMYLTGTLET